MTEYFLLTCFVPGVSQCLFINGQVLLQLLRIVKGVCSTWKNIRLMNIDQIILSSIGDFCVNQQTELLSWAIEEAKEGFYVYMKAGSIGFGKFFKFLYFV